MCTPNPNKQTLITRGINFIKYRKTDLFLRISAIILTLWWSILLASFGENVEVLPVPILRHIKGLLIFSVAHSSLWLASTQLGKNIRWLLMVLLVPSLIFYAQTLPSKILAAMVLGTVAYLVAIIHVLMSKPILWRRN